MLAALAPQPNPWRRALQVAQGRPRPRLRLVAAPRRDPSVQILAAASRRLSAHEPNIDECGLFSYQVAAASTPRFDAAKRPCEACWQQAPGTIITQPHLRGACRIRSANCWPRRPRRIYRPVSTSASGRVAEWFKAPVLKTGRGFRSLVSSNLTPSAIARDRRAFNVRLKNALFTRCRCHCVELEHRIRSVSGKPGGHKQLLLLRRSIVFYWIKAVHLRREGKRSHVALRVCRSSQGCVKNGPCRLGI
jgi:hypothetical protein